jgi:hypothetical protein
MNKKYFYITLLICLFSLVSFGQDSKQTTKLSEQSSDVLGFYPNPVSNGKIYIISKNTTDKEITIFDVLGKKVTHTILNNKELNISSLTSGVYIIQIKEGENTATRKLIVK